MTITLCGSMKFSDQMKNLTEELVAMGYRVFMPTMSYNSFGPFSCIFEHAMLANVHRNKIAESDLIIVMNVDDYIGDDTRNEIKLAKKLGKGIIYYDSQSPFEISTRIIHRQWDLISMD